MASPDYAEYLDQLARLPGGTAAALADFLGPCLAGPEQVSDQGLPCWPLEEGGRLCLNRQTEAQGLRLVHEDAGRRVEIAHFGRDLLDAATQNAERAVSPMVLALLAIAAGDVDDGRRLKRHLPRLDAAARDLMLMSLCRLCG